MWIALTLLIVAAVARLGWQAWRLWRVLPSSNEAFGVPPGEDMARTRALPAPTVAADRAGARRSCHA